MSKNNKNALTYAESTMSAFAMPMLFDSAKKQEEYKQRSEENILAMVEILSRMIESDQVDYYAFQGIRLLSRELAEVSYLRCVSQSEETYSEERNIESLTVIGLIRKYLEHGASALSAFEVARVLEARVLNMRLGIDEEYEICQFAIDCIKAHQDKPKVLFCIASHTLTVSITKLAVRTLNQRFPDYMSLFPDRDAVALVLNTVSGN